MDSDSEDRGKKSKKEKKNHKHSKKEHKHSKHKKEHKHSSKRERDEESRPIAATHRALALLRASGDFDHETAPSSKRPRLDDGPLPRTYGPTPRTPAAATVPPSRAHAIEPPLSRMPPRPKAPVLKDSGLALYFKCACCRTEASGEASFAEHCAGRAHRNRNSGRPGFAGLLPNQAGIIPPLRIPELRAQALAFNKAFPVDGRDANGASFGSSAAGSTSSSSSASSGQSALSAGPWAPPMRRVGIPVDTLAAVRAALAAGSGGSSNGHGNEGNGEDDGSGAEEDNNGEDKDETGSTREGSNVKSLRRQENLRPPPAVYPEGGPMRAVRETLPVFTHRAALLDAFRDSPSGACVIEGETGSGKTTQVAQYILEDARARGAGVQIVCTQPRRISAISVAERVAAERGENVGGTVGYAIRGETKAGANTQLLFCTTGILLRRLESDPFLVGTTHVLVDEVHERSLESDFLLMALRKLLLKQQQQRKQRHEQSSSKTNATTTNMDRHSTLAVGLMSATMPGELMTSYLGGPTQCPRVSFPGRAFPVASLYLEEALALVPSYRVDSHADWSRYSMNAQRRQRQRQASMGDKGSSATSSSSGGGSSSSGASSSSSSSNEPPLMFGANAAENARRFPHMPSSVHTTMASLDEDAVNVQLIVELCQWYKSRGGVEAALRHCDRARLGRGTGSSSSSSGGGSGDALAVLVFLPGTREIQDVQDALLRTPEFGAAGGNGEQPNWVLPLHGALPPEEQRRVFERPPVVDSRSSGATSNVVKVILSTNVAETSVTIDDVGFVIDAGRVKEERYYPDRRMAALEDVWISRASSRQRRGRAGRVRPGLCVHLFPSDARLAEHAQPEVRRVALDQLVLRIKALGLQGSATEVCNQLVEPPDHAAVVAAVRELAAIGALKLRPPPSKNSEVLTALGRALTQLPVDARLGKLLLLGCSFRAIDQALTISSALAARSPFLSPLDARDAADASKRGFARDAAPKISTDSSNYSRHLDSPYGGADSGGRSYSHEDASSSSSSSDWGRLPSDLLAVHQAYSEFDARGNNDRGCSFARERLLGIKSLLQMATLKRQLLEALSACIGSQTRIVPPGLKQSGLESLGRRYSSCDGVRPALDQWRAEQELDAQHRQERKVLTAQDWSDPRNWPDSSATASSSSSSSVAEAPREASAELLAGLVAAALFPQVAYVDAPPKKAKGGAPALPCGPENVKLLVRDPEGLLLEPGSKASVHPSSVGAKLGGNGWPSPFVAFHERVLTTKVYVRDVTPVPPLALVLLCGGHLTCEDKNDGRGWATLAVDGWLRLQVPTSAAPVLMAARKRVNALVQSLVASAAAAGASTTSSSHRASILTRLGDPSSQGALLSDGSDGQESAMECEAAVEAGLLTALELLFQLPVLPEAPIVVPPKAKSAGTMNKNAKKRASKKKGASSSIGGGGGKGYGSGGKGGYGGGKGGGGSGYRRHHGTIVGPDVSSIWGGFAELSGHDW